MKAPFPLKGIAFAGLLALAGCEDQPAADQPSGPTTSRAAEVTLDNGLTYREIKAGSGRATAAGDYVTLHYRAFRLDGTTLADSRRAGEPLTFRLEDTLPGWQEALSRMSEGDVWRLTVPADLAYGDEGFGDVIAPGEDLEFELSLLKLHTQEEWDALRVEAFKAARKHRADNAAYLEENAARAGVITTDSGLQYEVLQEGGGQKPTAGDTVRVHYRGTLIDGTEFDSSYSRNKPSEFKVGGVIRGWQEALQIMNAGAKYRLVIPADLAYGDRQVGELIKPGSTLVFEVELLDVLNGDEAD